MVSSEGTMYRQQLDTWNSRSQHPSAVPSRVLVLLLPCTNVSFYLYLFSTRYLEINIIVIRIWFEFLISPMKGPYPTSSVDAHSLATSSYSFIFPYSTCSTSHTPWRVDHKTRRYVGARGARCRSRPGRSATPAPARSNTTTRADSSVDVESVYNP